MIEINRRLLMFGASALLAAKPKLLLSPMPILYGDGIQDDTGALQELFKGRPVKLPNGETFRSVRDDGWVGIKGGKFRYTQNIFSGEVSSFMHGAVLIFAGDEPSFLNGVLGGKPIVITCNRFSPDPFVDPMKLEPPAERPGFRDFRHKNPEVRRIMRELLG